MRADSDNWVAEVALQYNDTYTEIQEAGTITTSLTANAELYPAAHVAITNTADANNTSVQHKTGYYIENNPDDPNNPGKITKDQYDALPDDDARAEYDEELTSAATNWYYKIADKPTESGSSKAPTYLTSSNLESYVVHKICYVTMAAGSNAGTDLKVSEVTFGAVTGGSATLEPVKVLVTSATAAAEFDNEHNSSDTVLASTVTDSGVIRIDIYIYYDGNHEDVSTANVANLDGANISITFAVAENN